MFWFVTSNLVFFFCNFSTSANCPLAGGSVPFRLCPACRLGGFKFKVHLKMFTLFWWYFYRKGAQMLGKFRRFAFWQLGSLIDLILEFFVSCSNYPECKASFSLPTDTESATILKDRPCVKCSYNDVVCYCVELHFKKTMPGIGKSIIGCLSGCETTMNDLILMRNANAENYLIPPNFLPTAPPLPRANSHGWYLCYINI